LREVGIPSLTMVASGSFAGDTEDVPASWWLASQASTGGAAVKDNVAVLELAEAASNGSDRVVGSAKAR
jgi:hypothetical protein